MKTWRKRVTQVINQSINQSMSSEGVCRTAPATPGLFTTRSVIDSDFGPSSFCTGVIVGLLYIKRLISYMKIDLDPI